MLVYLRQNVSFQFLGLLFQVSESTAYKLFNYWQKIFQEELLPSLLEQVKNSPEEKEGNKAISSKRIFVEHLIRIIKTFKII